MVEDSCIQQASGMFGVERAFNDVMVGFL